jgi:hypothetical protein
MPEPERHVGKTEARGGTTPHMVRYVLVFGIGLTVLAFALILFVWR